MHDESPSVLGFRPMALLARSKRGGHTDLWRHLWSDDQFMYVMPVEEGKPPKNSRPYLRWDMREVKSLFGNVIFEVEEVVCPKWMLETKPTKEQATNTGYKWSKIAWIIEKGKEKLIIDKYIRADLISEAAKIAKVTKPYIRSLLTRYYYYGGHPNALMSLDKFKGHRGPLPPNVKRKKLGRPNDNVKLNPNTHLTGHNMSQYYLKHWREVLIEEATLGNLNVSECYDKLLLRLRVTNRNADGELVSYPIAPHKIPEKSLFLRYGTRIIHELELKRMNAGHLEWRQKHAAQKGNAEDLTQNVIDIYDFDGTEFNIEILFGKRQGRRHVGKPLVLIAIDRRSRAVVGWYVWLGRENGFAYKHCLFNAFTPKESRLIKHGVQHLRGFVYGPCEQAFFDRGPGIAISPSKAITQENRVDALIAKPRDAGGKGIVENIIGIFEAKLSRLRGAFKRTKKIRDNDKHSNAEREAAVYFDQFMRLLLNAISDYNLYAPIRRTRAMLESKNPPGPNPKSIFLWYRSRKNGDAAYNWPEETIYKRLCDRDTVSASDGIVTLGRAHYRSTELERYYENWKNGPYAGDASPEVTVYSLEEDKDVVLWERADGSLAVLKIMKKSKQEYGTAERWEHDYINRLANADERKQRIQHMKNGTLSKAMEEVIQETDGLAKRKASKGQKLKDRSDANAILVKDQLDDTLQMLGINRDLGGSLKAPEDTSLTGYRPAAGNEERVDTDW